MVWGGEVSSSWVSSGSVVGFVQRYGFGPMLKPKGGCEVKKWK